MEFLVNKSTQVVNRLKNLWGNSPTAKNILKVSAGDIGSKILSATIAFMLIRTLSITDYATYTTFSGVSFFFSGLIGAGINMALVRFSSDHISIGKAKPLHLYVFAFLFQLAIYALVAGLCLLFPAQSTRLLFGRAELILPFQLGLLAGLGMLIIQFARSLYQAEERFNHYIGTLWLVQIVIFASLVILGLFRHLSFLPVAMIFATTQCVIGIWLPIKYLRPWMVSSLRILYLKQRMELNQFLVSSGWLMGYMLILNLFSRMDVLMLLRFQGKEELAVYGVAFQYYSLSLLFLGSIHAVLLPKFAKADMQDAERQKTFLKQWLSGSIWLAIPIALFDLFGKSIFVWINGRVYERAFPIFIVFSVGIWLSMMLSPLINILLGKSKFRFLFFLALIAFCVNILLNLLLVPLLGGIGAATVVVLSNLIINMSATLRILSDQLIGQMFSTRWPS